jgi:hypothetical protein
MNVKIGLRGKGVGSGFGRNLDHFGPYFGHFGLNFDHFDHFENDSGVKLTHTDAQHR